MVIILQPPGIPHQLLRDLVRSADAADPDDVPGDALQAVALLLLRHIKVVTLTESDAKQVVQQKVGRLVDQDMARLFSKYLMHLQQ